MLFLFSILRRGGVYRAEKEPTLFTYEHVFNIFVIYEYCIRVYCARLRGGSRCFVLPFFLLRNTRADKNSLLVCRDTCNNLSFAQNTLLEMYNNTVSYEGDATLVFKLPTICDLMIVVFCRDRNFSWSGIGGNSLKDEKQSRKISSSDLHVYKISTSFHN